MNCSALDENVVTRKTCYRPFAGSGRQIILLHDNARSHTVKATLEIIFSLG